MNQTNIYLFPLFFKTFLFLWWLGLIFLSFWGFDNNPCAGILRGCVKSKSKKNLVEDCILDFFDGKIIIFTFARGSNFHLKYGLWQSNYMGRYNHPCILRGWCEEKREANISVGWLPVYIFSFYRTAHFRTRCFLILLSHNGQVGDSQTNQKRGWEVIKIK